MILSACSSYFEQLFINFNEPHQVVILKDTSFADIVAIVEFMYKGEINVSQVGKRRGGLQPSGNLHLQILLLCLGASSYGSRVPQNLLFDCDPLKFKTSRLPLCKDISLVQVSFGKSLDHIMWIFITVNYCSRILRAQGWLKF